MIKTTSEPEPMVCLKCGRVILDIKTWGKHAIRCGIPFPYDPDTLTSAKESYKQHFAKKTLIKQKPEREEETGTEEEQDESMQDTMVRENEEAPQEGLEGADEEVKTVKKKAPQAQAKIGKKRYVCPSCKRTFVEKPDRCECGEEFE